MAISVNYRGDVKAKEANATVQWIKTNKKATFVGMYLFVLLYIYVLWTIDVIFRMVSNWF